ncbi:MAG: DUF362 domain-containing protein, partial [Armatimonadetes bacterium]|nr:DUF362 domain-containing protein [Armatimonadota bacterium]
VLGACKPSAGAQGDARIAQAGGATPPAPEGGKTPIAIVKHSHMLADPHTPSSQAVLDSLDTAIKYVFGEEDAAKAWAHVCGPDDTVAIKVNCISRLIFSHPVVVAAIVQRLQDLGVPAEKIIIWDRSTGELARSGYEIRREGKGVRCYGTDGAYDEWLQHRSISTRLSKILTQTATVLINVPILKDHGGAGVTLAMKNHYGSVANPGDLHANNCDPAIAHLSDVPVIRTKTRLVVLDATKGLYNGGPGGRPEAIWPAQTLIVSANPVATDAIGLEMIDAKRAEHGMGPVRPRAKHVATAAQIGLGPNNRADMSVLETTVG